MEAFPVLPQQQGPPSAERDAPKASTVPRPDTEVLSKGRDAGRLSEIQEHHVVEPFVEKTAMDIPGPLTSSIQDHHKEAQRAPEELDHSKPAAEVNLRNTHPQDHHPMLPGLQEHHKETSTNNSLFEKSLENDASKTSITHDGYQKEPSPMKEAIDTTEHPKEPAIKSISSEHHQGELNEKGSSGASHHIDPLPEGRPVVAIQPTHVPTMLSQHQGDLATDVHMKISDPEVKLTLMQEELHPGFEQRAESKQPNPSLEKQPLATPMEQSLNVPIVRDSTPQVAMPEDLRIIDPTMHATIDSLAEKDHNPSEKPAVSVVIPQQESDGRQQVGVKGEPTTFPAEVQQNSTEQSSVKEYQINTSQSSKKPTRAEIDTAAPFESVKAAVSLFGERMDWRPQSRPLQAHNVERRVLPESELHKVQDDLVHYKDQLALTQASTAGVLLELKKVKRLIQNPGSNLGGADILSNKSLEAANAWKNQGASYTDNSNNEFTTILREVESVKEELISATGSKETAVNGLQDALSSLNSVLKRVDELASEKKSLDEAVIEANIALADAEEQVALLKSGQKVESLNSMPSDFMEKKSAEIRGLESKLGETTAMITALKEELLASKKAESLAVAAASETQKKMAMVKVELDQAKSEELSMVGKLATILEESDELKAKLDKAVQENATLSSTIDALKLNIEQDRKEFDSMHEREQMACATLASLQDELQRLKEALRSAQGGEARALEAKETLPAAIKQTAFEADQAKAAAVASKEEARRARQEIGQAKAATSTACSRLQAASKELEAARASETMALAELKALTESESQSAGMELAESEGVMGVSISLEEYGALKQAAVEAEGLADKKVLEVIAQVEAAKASQEKAQVKLEEAAMEAEKGTEELSKAQKLADDAQESKVTAEGELRKWRAEHDQRRKSGVPPLDPKAGTARNLPRKDSEDEKLASFGSYEKEDVGRKNSGRDSLAQVMSLEAPTPEMFDRLVTAEDAARDPVRVKKRNLIRRLAAIVALKKKP